MSFRLKNQRHVQIAKGQKGRFALENLNMRARKPASWISRTHAASIGVHGNCVGFVLQTNLIEASNTDQRLNEPCLSKT